MDISQIISFTLVAALLVISPGPNGVLIARSVSLRGKSAGFFNIAGFVMAFYIHGSFSILGISLLLVQSSHAFFIFKMLGAIYLIWLGLNAFWDAWICKVEVKNSHARNMSTSMNMPSAFFEGFLTNLLNPKVSLFYLAAFPQFISGDTTASSAFVLVFMHSLVNMLWFSLMVLFLVQIKKMAFNQVFSRCFKVISGAIFIGFGMQLAFLKSLKQDW